jgi:predicted metalloprotease with PDZ domain
MIAVVQRSLLVLALTAVTGGWGLEAGNGFSRPQASSLQPPGPITYHLSFPEPQHHWMQVEASFPDIGSGTLELRMSRSSPGRYSLHDFAKNVYDVHVTGAGGREIETTRPDPYGWNAGGHGGSATVRYKVYGDRVDGTYLAIDTTHAHINMPAAIMWAHGFDDRPVTVTFDQPAGLGHRWLVATQLHGEGFPILTNAPIPQSYTFSAPNLQYLMDSPAEMGALGIRRFSVGSKAFRFALHHLGTEEELDTFAKDVEKIVREEGAIYGEYPNYEPGYYTFLADYLPYAGGDGMEHRNSTVISAGGSIAAGRVRLLDTVAHEFFHCWNVERIRPKSLEPFDFDRANMSGELWLAEGFTQYYGPLALQRTELVDLTSTLRTFSGLIESVSAPGHFVRSAEEMSRMAPFIDGGRTSDRTNWSTTVISYYPFGGAIALALDLSLRDRTDSRLSLDDFMRVMWTKFGKPGGTREGYVDRPYTIADAEATLADVSGDRAFAHDFFSRYIQGHDVADYAKLLGRAGFTVRRRSAGRAWLGDVRLESRNGARITTLVAPTWPVYATGLDQDDELQQLDGQKIGGDADIATVLQRHKPGDAIPIVFADRTGVAQTRTITLGEDPHLEVVDAGAPNPAQRAFRDRWLKSRQ